MRHLVLLALLVSSVPSPAVTGPTHRIHEIAHWPESPRLNAWGIDVVDTTAYVAGGQGGLFIFDVSDLRQPRLIGRHQVADRVQGVVVETNEFVAVRVEVGRAYLASRHGGLAIVDVTDPTRPVSLSQVSAEADVVDLDIESGYVFLATIERGLLKADVSRDRIPTIEPVTSRTPRSTPAVDVQGEWMISAEWNFGALVHRRPRNDPYATLPSRSLPIPGGFVAGAALGDSLAFISRDPEGLEIFDLSNADLPVLVGKLPSLYEIAPRRVRVFDRLATVCGIQLALVDASSPATPTILGRFSPPDTVRDCAVIGTTAFVAAGAAGLRIVDISDAKRPIEVGHWSNGGQTSAIAVREHRYYLGGRAPDLQILQTDDAGKAEPLGEATRSGMGVNAMLVHGNRAYVGDRAGILRTFDLSDPAQPKVLPNDLSLGLAYAIRQDSNHLFVATSRGLHILDLVDPSNPRKVSQWGRSSSVYRALYVTNGIAVLGGDAGLEILDISQPSSPQWRGADTGARVVHDLDVHGAFAFVALGTNGSRIEDLRDPKNPRRLTDVGTFGSRAWRVRIMGDRLLTSDRGRNLDARLWTPPTSTSKASLKSLALPWSARGNIEDLAVDQDRIYLAEGGWGIQIVELTTRSNQTLTFTPPASIPLDQLPLTLEATSSKGLPVEFAVVEGTARIEGQQLHADRAGRVTLRAFQPGDPQTLPAETTVSLEILPLVQSITWSKPPPRRLALGDRIDIEAVASSGLPVTIRVAAGPGSISGTFLTVPHVGPVHLVAEQVGDERFAPARAHVAVNVPVLRWVRRSLVSEIAALARPQDSRLFIAGENAGMTLVDIADPGNPTVLGRYDEGVACADALPLGGRVLIAGKLKVSTPPQGVIDVVDLTDPRQPSRLSRLSRNQVSYRSLTAEGTRLFAVGLGSSGRSGTYEIFDLGDPLSLHSLHESFVSQRPYKAMAGRGWVAMANSPSQSLSGSVLIPFMDGIVPRPVSRLSPSGFASDLHFDGTNVFLASSTGGLSITDCREPTFPRWVGSIGTNGTAVTVRGTIAFLATSDYGLEAYDVSYSPAPQLLGRLADLDGVRSLTTDDRLIFAAAGTNGVHLLEVVGPQEPRLQVTVPDRVALAVGKIRVNTTSDSPLPVTVSVVRGPARGSGNDLELTGPGEVLVRVSQEGDDEWWSAVAERRLFVEPTGLATQLADWFARSHASVPQDQRQPTQDPDGDGAVNAIEFVLLDNPEVARPGDGRLPPGRIVTGEHGNEWVLEFEANPDFPVGSGWDLEESAGDALVQWSPLPVSLRVQDGGRVVARVPISTFSRYLRIRIDP
ncbi:MAG: hypothetical protein JNK85_26430 [Verrucomicrobiales bacterium]|nr:hypothetical protein [Verrucomicrobiales bacterium]